MCPNRTGSLLVGGTMLNQRSHTSQSQCLDAKEPSVKVARMSPGWGAHGTCPVHLHFPDQIASGQGTCPGLNYVYSRHILLQKKSIRRLTGRMRHGKMKNDRGKRTRVRPAPQLSCEISLGAKGGPQVSHVPPQTSQQGKSHLVSNKSQDRCAPPSKHPQGRPRVTWGQLEDLDWPLCPCPVCSAHPAAQNP